MLMRSKLFVPGSRPELFHKACASAADAISLDLEDAVAPDRKTEARAAVASFLQDRSIAPGKIMIVRVNAVGTALFMEDLQAIMLDRLDLINLPMVEDPAAISEAASMLDKMDPLGRIGLLINIETAKGLRCAASLATASPRVAGLQIGYADLLEPLGIGRHDPAALAYLRMALRMAAAEAGVPAYDGAYAAVKDPEGYRAECDAARQHGFAGKSCIHPTQIAIANEAFKPKPAEIQRARRIVAAAGEAEANGIGAYLVDGQMIDPPFLASARAIVALAELHERTGT